MKSLFNIALAAALVLAAAPVAWAGGWSVVTLDATPADVRAGEAFTVGFVVRQHGVHPIGDLSPQLVFSGENTAQVVEVTARAEGTVGHYLAEVTLPAAGTWTWRIEAYGPEAPMSPIQVAAAAPVPVPAPQAVPVPWPALAALALAAAAVLALMWRRGEARRRLPTA
jgi:hypothetical protein